MQALPNAGKPVDGDYPQPTTTTLPILTLGNDDTATWDYAVFLQAEQDDIGYLAEESSTSRATPPPIMSASPTSASSLSSVSSVPLHPLAPRQHRRISPAAALTPYSHGDAVHGESSMSHGTQAQPRQRLERRGHTKSRRGCFNCKRRRIKCQETRPACGHCVKQGLKCEYPALPTIVHQPQHQIPIFSLQDMRFFQHFLLNCYPHHPLGSEDLWLHDIPCLSQKYDYLMHAILGYSASSLISPAEPTLASAAMAHRLKAIRAIKKSLADASRQQQQHHRRQHQHQHQHQHQEGAVVAGQEENHQHHHRGGGGGQDGGDDGLAEEGNALMATCYALTYQSVYLDDGMAEYMSFIRGIIIVAIAVYCRGAGGRLMFARFLEDEREKKVLEPHMRELPLIERAWAEGALEGVEGLRALVDGVEGREVERGYWELIGEIARMLLVSSWKAYLALSEHYKWWMMLPHDKFQRLVDPNNQVAILLGAHWIALQQIMAPICEAEEKCATKMPQRSPEAGISVGIIRWLKYLNAQVDREHAAYNRWPRWVEAQLDRDRGFFGRTR